MTKVLLVGLKPEAVDYSDPALPPGMNAKKIQAAIDLGLVRDRSESLSAIDRNHCPHSPESAKPSPKIARPSRRWRRSSLPRR
jgi:hypothetical protein